MAENCARRANAVLGGRAWADTTELPLQRSARVRTRGAHCSTGPWQRQAALNFQGAPMLSNARQAAVAPRGGTPGSRAPRD